jgi:hypothetical protein
MRGAGKTGRRTCPPGDERAPRSCSGAIAEEAERFARTRFGAGEEDEGPESECQPL